MSMPSILRSICFLVGVFAVGQAVAQSVTPPQPAKSPPPSAGRSTAVGPVAHRQPRAADVPAPTDSSPNSFSRENQDDETMNRIIRGICRGC